MKRVSLDDRRPNHIALSLVAALGLAVPLACSGGSSGGAGHQNANGGAAGTTGATGGSGGSGGASGATDAGMDTSTPQDSGQQDVVTPPDAGTDSGACQITNGGVEICDGLDNDCNGKVDDHVAVPGTSPPEYTGDPCEPGQSQCGVWVCPSFGTKPQCSVSGGNLVEKCDGKDDNCDGIIDNVQGIGDSCGQCKDGHLQCPGDAGAASPGDAGALGLICVGATQPQVETCDGKDDDCDGKIDDVAPANTPTCAPSSPSGLACDGNGNLIGSVPEICDDSVSPAQWKCPQADPPYYYYLDADGDSYPEPIPGVGAAGVIGPVHYNYKYGPYCDRKESDHPATTPPAPGTAKWIWTPYDWAKPAQRAADPKHANLSAINSGFDCCDDAPKAYPGQLDYFQAKPSGGDSPLPSVCTGAGVLAWDYNCDGSLQRRAPDGSGTAWNQCANNCYHKPGWDTLLTLGCPKDCGDTSGHWITGWDSGCGVTSYLKGWAPQCH